MHDTGLEGALRVADGICAAVASMPPVADGLHLTASIGVASFPLHGGSLDDAVHAADHAMYQAKARGRDCVVSAEGKGLDLSPDPWLVSLHSRVELGCDM